MDTNSSLKGIIKSERWGRTPCLNGLVHPHRERYNDMATVPSFSSGLVRITWITSSGSGNCSRDVPVSLCWMPESLPLVTLLGCSDWEHPGAAGLAPYRSFSPRLVTRVTEARICNGSCLWGCCSWKRDHRLIYIIYLFLTRAVRLILTKSRRLYSRENNLDEEF